MMEVYIWLIFIMFVPCFQSLCRNGKMQPVQEGFERLCIQNMQLECSKYVNVSWAKPDESRFVQNYTVKVMDDQTRNLIAEKVLPNTTYNWYYAWTEKQTQIRVEVWSLNVWDVGKLHTVVSKDCEIPHFVTSRIQTSTSRLIDPSTESLDILTYVTLESTTHNYTYGNTVKLLCTSDCLSPCTYTWYKNNTHLPWINRSGYTIDKLSFGDTGTYVCSVQKGNLSKSSNVLNITVTGIANVILKMSSDNIIEGKTRDLKISCQAECNPPCKYQILKDGNILKNSVIDQVSRTDSGEYQCLAENSVTSDRSFVQLLDVKYGPTFVNASLPQYLIKGDRGVTLRCSADCLPACSYKWFKDKTVLTKTHNIEFKRKVKIKDKGNYTCQATNGIGEASVSEYIQVYVKPSRLNIIKSKDKPIEHGNLRITCQTRCHPPCKFYWTYTESQQNVSYKRYINFTSIPRTKAGNYICTAYNKFGRKSNTTYINVYYGPKFVNTSLPSQGYLIKDMYYPAFSCSAECFPPCTYSFFKGNAKQRILLNHRATYSDKGRYTCKATNEIGEASASRFLNVYVKPSRIRIIKSKPYPSENVEFDMECNTEYDCIPPCQFFWKNLMGKNVSYSRYYRFQSIQRRDAGKYTCTAYNILGGDSETTSFQVYYAHVSMNVSPSKTSIRVGHPFPKIECTTRCYVSCSSLKYIRNNRIISMDRRDKNATIDDAGNYTCRASYYNYTLGRTIYVFSSSVSITVLYDRLYIDTNRRKLRIREGTTRYRLSCILSCNPKCTELSLLKNRRFERLLKYSGNIFGNISLLRNNTGTYQCQAKTSNGQMLKSDEINIDIQYKPEIYPSFENQIVLIERQSINISWTVESNPTANFFVVRNGKKTGLRPNATGKSRLYSLQLQTVSCWDKGLFKAVATNDIGNETSSFSLTVMCKPRLQDGKFTSNMSVSQPIFSKVEQQWNIYSYPESNVTLMLKNERRGIQRMEKSFGLSYQLKETINGSLFSLSIPNVTEDLFGKYTIFLQNSVGILQINLNVSPSGPPLPPTNVRADCSRPTQSLLSWRPHFPGGSPQTFGIHIWSNNTWVKIKENITDDRNEKGLVDVVLDDLTEDEHYEFRISSINGGSKEVFALDTVNCTILPKISGHKASQGIDIIGPAIGTCVSLVALIALIIAILVIRRKQKDNTKCTTHPFQDEHVVGSLAIVASGKNENVYSHITPTTQEETSLEGATSAEVDLSRKGGYGPSKSDTCSSAVPHIYDVPKSSRWKNQDGLVYTEVELTKSQASSNTVIGDDVRTTYTEVEFVKP